MDGLRKPIHRGIVGAMACPRPVALRFLLRSPMVSNLHFRDEPCFLSQWGRGTAPELDILFFPFLFWLNCVATPVAGKQHPNEVDNPSEGHDMHINVFYANA